MPTVLGRDTMLIHGVDVREVGVLRFMEATEGVTTIVWTSEDEMASCETYALPSAGSRRVAWPRVRRVSLRDLSRS